ncbi:DUF481 domain-containing protein [Fibrivirga algicola]|uniref:DUF481 domain-containing protein n=1 Tax=Fibrivirga algicola TaxID=2950420 RepID=A0ABX0QGQ6_9BACT|nr:DUF481 domain-containing protein [Fibrivirga algicola]ARK09380.1 hypothetical protein A6C57_03020 [Fibrella sp. ES10-3-2-2]NID10252.1 DUF481 domain-containing protein [Fibrivirga algicola]
MRFLLLFLLFLPIYTLSAQNTEQPDPLRPSVPDSAQVAADSTRMAADSSTRQRNRSFRPTYRFRLTTDGTFTSGNVNRSLLQIVSAFDVEVSKIAKLSTTPSFVFGRQSGLLAEREYFGDARLTMFHENRLYYLAFGSYERSNLRQISHRYTAAAGFGYKLLARKRAYLSITNVLMREYTDFIELSDVNIWRNSARLFGEYTFDNDRWTVSHTVFYQPALSRQEGQPFNIRWNGNVSVQYKFSTYLSFRTTLANSYERIVVPGRVNNDLRLTVGMTYERK